MRTDSFINNCTPAGRVKCKTEKPFFDFVVKILFCDNFLILQSFEWQHCVGVKKKVVQLVKTHLLHHLLVYFWQNKSESFYHIEKKIIFWKWASRQCNRRVLTNWTTLFFYTTTMFLFECLLKLRKYRKMMFLQRNRKKVFQFYMRLFHLPTPMLLARPLFELLFTNYYSVCQ
jgi:hypothetical protein